MNYTHKPSKNIHKSSIIPNEMGLFFLNESHGFFWALPPYLARGRVDASYRRPRCP